MAARLASPPHGAAGCSATTSPLRFTSQRHSVSGSSPSSATSATIPKVFRQKVSLAISNAPFEFNLSPTATWLKKGTAISAGGGSSGLAACPTVTSPTAMAITAAPPTSAQTQEGGELRAEAFTG